MPAKLTHNYQKIILGEILEQSMQVRKNSHNENIWMGKFQSYCTLYRNSWMKIKNSYHEVDYILSFSISLFPCYQKAVTVTFYNIVFSSLPVGQTFIHIWFNLFGGYFEPEWEIQTSFWIWIRKAQQMAKLISCHKKVEQRVRQITSKFDIPSDGSNPAFMHCQIDPRQTFPW